MHDLYQRAFFFFHFRIISKYTTNFDTLNHFSTTLIQLTQIFNGIQIFYTKLMLDAKESEILILK